MRLEQIYPNLKNISVQRVLNIPSNSLLKYNQSPNNTPEEAKSPLEEKKY
jgi:hypothetical protein